MLHARALAFDHPITGKRHDFEANPPADFLEIARQLNL
jgi:23S rRNA-/tRNA-specific pseudouridylate synthase